MLQHGYPGDGGFAGHNAIRIYFDFDGGMGKSGDDFMAPDRFPGIIANNMKAGAFRGLCMNYDLLTPEAVEEYKKYKGDLEEKNQQIFWDLFANQENRAEAWR